MCRYIGLSLRSPPSTSAYSDEFREKVYDVAEDMEEKEEKLEGESQGVPILESEEDETKERSLGCC